MPFKLKIVQWAKTGDEPAELYRLLLDQLILIKHHKLIYLSDR
jgi:hypothetical protein